MNSKSETPDPNFLESAVMAVARAQQILTLSTPEELPLKTVEEISKQVNRVLEELRGNPEFKDFMSGTILDANPGAETVERPIQEALIYVVDDEPTLLRLHLRLLKKMGFTNVKIFGDGEEAVSAMFSDRKTGPVRVTEVPHLIVSDTEMPGINGHELAKFLQHIHPSHRPRFIACTGRFTSDVVGPYSRYGYNVLNKPFSTEDLKDLIAGELMQHPGFRAAKQ